MQSPVTTSQSLNKDPPTTHWHGSHPFELIDNPQCSGRHWLQLPPVTFSLQLQDPWRTSQTLLPLIVPLVSHEHSEIIGYTNISGINAQRWLTNKLSFFISLTTIQQYKIWIWTIWIFTKNLEWVSKLLGATAKDIVNHTEQFIHSQNHAAP